MGPNEYQGEARITATWPAEDKSYARRYIGVALGGELGELLNVLKKEMRARRPFYDKLIDEIGDIYWYATAYLDLIEETLDQALYDAPHYAYDDPLTLEVALLDAAKRFAEAVTWDDFEAKHQVLRIFGLLDGLMDARKISREEVFAGNIAKITHRKETGTIKEHD